MPRFAAVNQLSLPVLLVHAFAAVFMTGLIWTIQLVHYPLFAKVGAEAFHGYELDHMRRITWIVGPAMFIKAASMAALFVVAPPTVPRWMLLLAGALLLAIWVSTAVLQGPMHVSLSRQYDPRVIDRLVNTNWIRTIAWTARGVLALAMIERALRA